MTETNAQPEIDAATLKKIEQMRSHVRQSFGQVVMSMMALPRYRHQSLMDLQHLVLEPLMQDRIAMAMKSGEAGTQDLAGMAIWASVSKEVDAKIRDQIKAGAFPIRLKADEWRSGDINWLLDIIAGDKKTAGTVLTNFRQVVKEGDLRLHPLVGRLVDPGLLEQLTGKAEAKAEPADA
ncbi:toxin-activating lysine-acyltransferase [Tropicibacter naphthalenivorans]|uniref:RTX toxin-activating lysine-acyltransferase n=1 Tax=Tropicibacter naphthalenivorans TaxID=441103 RepID=A0A0P1GHE8_9RHOB|nr:toxin-activating lysine-acyltransferase [Tropicibacter naphthalenivorans]CUH81108.1 ACP:hemolysin acyltransferase (hemolysin-activating protein) [Tropicibacter naphthalenivorans]SMC97197.1 RTX toxin acyltransferase family protein [Tropicibacter naphthalenivorans]